MIFERRAAERFHVLEAVVRSQVEDLRAVLALFLASDTVGRREFGTFAGAILEHSHFLALEWIPRVTADRRATYESLGRLHAPSFSFRDWTAVGSFEPAAERSEYYPVYYLEPQGGNERALGVDLADEPKRREALLAARDSGELKVAGPFPLIQAPSNAAGYLLFLPHYRHHTRPDTVALRRLEIEGLVVGVLQLGRVLAFAMSHFSPLEADVSVTDAGTPVAWYGADGGARAGMARPSWLTREVPDQPHVLELGDHRLLVHYSPTEAFVRERSSLIPSVLLLGGGGFTIIVASYLFWLQHVIERERKMATALRDGEARYRSLVDHAPEAVIVFEPETLRFTEVNPSAESLLKMSHEDLLAIGPADVTPPLQPDGRPSEDAARAYIGRALRGETPVFPWLARDSRGNDVHCEIRLVRLPGTDRQFVRASVVDISERREAEERQRVLLRELDHRVKNNLATVLSLADQTGLASRSFEEFQKSFTGRVRALTRAHEALAARDWQGAELDAIARLVLGPYDPGFGDRISLVGEPTVLDPSAAPAISMILHELATNAAKHGALSSPQGRVELCWVREADGRVSLEWRERGGPAVGHERSEGIGTKLIRGLVEHELAGAVSMSYEPEGFSCRLTISTEHVCTGTGTGDMQARPARAPSRRDRRPEVSRT